MAKELEIERPVFGPGSGESSRTCALTGSSSQRVEVTDDTGKRRPRQLRELSEQDLSARGQGAGTASERQRLALTLFHYEGLSHVEIGEMMVFRMRR